MIIGDMEIRLRADIATLQRDMDRARGVVGAGMAQIERMAGMAKTALGALGAGLSVAAFAGWIKGAIDAADAVDELTEKTGLLASDVAGLQLIFEREGVGGDVMIASLSKLSKAVVEGNVGLSALGIKAKDAGGSFRSTKDVLYDVADQFAAMDNGVQKTALAIEVFGKSGANLIPMLNGGSQGMRDMAEMAQKLGLVIDEQTAKSAGDFNDTLFLLGQGSQGIARGLAAELLPTLTNLAGVFLQSMTEGDALVRTAAALSAGLKALYTVGAVVVETFKTVGTVIGGLAAGITNNLTGAIDVLVKVSNGDFKGAWDSMKKTVTSSTGIYVDAAKDIGSSWKSMGTNIAQAWESDGNAAVLAAAKQVKAQKDLLGNQKQREEADKKAAASREAAAKTAEKFIADQAFEIAQVGLAADQLKMLAAARAASLAPTDEQRKKIMEQALALDIATKAQNEKTEAEKAALAATAKADEALYAATAGVWDQVAAMEKQVELYGLSEDQVLRLQRTKLQADLAAADGDEKKIAALTLQIQGTERLIELNGGLSQKKADTKLAEDMLSEQKKSVEKYNDIFSKGFADMLNNGKAGWSSFTKSLTTTFKTSVADQIYKMFAQPFVVKMVASLLGVTGSAAAAAGGVPQAVGGVGSVADLLGTVKAGYTAITSGFAGIGSSVAEGVQSAINLFGPGTGMYSTAGSGLPVSQLANTMGTAASALAGIAAGFAAGKFISGGYSAIGGQSGNTAVLAGTAIGAIWGPLGSAIGGAIGGLVNRAFGMGAKTVTGTSLQGTLGADGFAGQNVSTWTQKGGWFRSDKSGTDRSAVDDVTVKALSDAYAGITSASAAYAQALGVNAEAIKTRTQSLNIALTKDQAANEKAVSEFFVNVANQIAAEAVPQLATFAKEGENAAATFERLATQYVALDGILEGMGTDSQKAFGAIGVASLAAREYLIGAVGGLDKLAAQSSYFTKSFLSEAEQLAPVQAAVAKRLAELGQSGLKTNEDFKAAVLGLQQGGALATESGATLYASLLELAPQFKLVTDYTESLTTVIAESAEVLQQRADLQEQYDQTFLSDKEKERAAIAATNLDLYDSLQVRLAEKAAIDAAAQAQADAAASLAAINKSYDEQIAAVLKARMSEADQLALERAGLDATTQSKFDYLNALKAEDAATKANADAAIAAAAAIAKAQADANAVQVKLMDDYLAASAAAYQKQLADQQVVASQYAAKETELYNLTHTEAEQLARARQLELDAMPATVAALQLQINAQKDLADAATKAANEIQAAAQKAAAIASERAGIQRDVLQLKGDAAGLRALELAALDPANRAAKQAYYDLQDKMAADQAASAAAQAWAQAQSNAAQSSIQAAEALKSAWKSATDSIFDEVARIRGLIDGNGAQTYAGAQSAFAVATAQARAGDQEAAKLLPGLSKAMLDLAEANAVTAFDLRLARAQAAASLYQTGSMIGGQYGIKVPAFAEGTDYVSRTGFALIHEGEKITPAASNRPFTRNSGDSSSELAGEMRQLRAENREMAKRLDAALTAIAKNTGKTADGIDGAVNGQRPLATKEIA